MINTLREGRGSDELCVGGITSAEYDEVCQERDAVKEELSQLRFRAEQLKAELQVSTRQYRMNRLNGTIKYDKNMDYKRLKDMMLIMQRILEE